MKIGAVICVKDEADVIVPHLLYHLDFQGFNTILVIENGSHDHTWELLEAMQDPRLILRRASYENGFVQDTATTTGARELFNKHGCDWVLPIDADEYWVSETQGTVRQALETVSTEYNTYFTQAYDFVFTELDGPSDRHFTQRIEYATLFPQPKTVLYRAGEELALWEIGNHSAVFKHPERQRVMEILPDVLCRYHYRYTSRQQILRKVLNKAEGYIIRTNGEWLYKEIPAGKHIRTLYQVIKEDRFDAWLRKRTLSRDQVEQRMGKGNLFHKTAMRLYREFFEAANRET